MAEGYTQQLPLSRSVVPLAPRNKSSIASAIGKGLGALGAAGQSIAESDRRTQDVVSESQFRIAEDQQRRARAMKSAGFAGQISEAEISYQEWAAEARKTTDPGAAGWTAQVKDKLDELFKPVMDGVADDPELADHLAPTVLSTTSRLLSGEIDWEGKQRAGWEGDQFNQYLTTGGNGLVSHPDSQAMGDFIDGGDRIIDAGDYDGNTRAKLHLNLRQHAVGSTLSGLEQQGNYGAIDKLVNSGAYDAYLGKDKDNWLATARAGLDAQTKAQEAAAADARKAAADALESLQVDIDNGNPPGVAQINQALAQAKAAGVGAADLKKFSYLASASVRAQQAQGLTSGAIEQGLEAVKAKRAQGQATPDDLAQQTALENELKARDSKAGEALKTGLSSANVADNLTALAALAPMSVEQRWRAADAAGHPEAALIAGLPGVAQETVLRGAAVRKAKPDAYMPTDAAGKPSQQAADAQFQSMLGPQLTRKLLESGRYQTVRDLALDYFAGSENKAGVTGGWSQQGMARSAAYIFGARPRADGSYEGGLGTVKGRRIELPNHWNSSEFDRFYSRFDFTRAEATYDGKTPAASADVLAHFTPIYAGADAHGHSLYRMEDARGRTLLKKGGAGVFYLPVPERF